MTAVGLTVFLGGASLFWSGSKSGWLIALGMGLACLLRLHWPRHLKWVAVVVIVVGGVAVFAVRYHEYFASGATSISARFDYWRAAAATTMQHPLVGTGPGKFQRPYAEIKAPESEMARLTHNDFLEQFSDSGVMGGLFYAAWIALALFSAWRILGEHSKAADPGKPAGLLHFAVFLGLAGWFAQGFAEFELYVPALAWTAFILTGAAVNRIDNPPPTGYSSGR